MRHISYVKKPLTEIRSQADQIDFEIRSDDLLRIIDLPPPKLTTLVCICNPCRVISSKCKKVY